jgi:N-acetylglutamate synthase-like GNAT family acetyltransferase
MIPPQIHKRDGSSADGFRLRPARRGDKDAMAALLGELGYDAGTDVQTVNWVISHPEMELFVAADAMDRAIGLMTLSHRPQLRLKGRVMSVDELVVLPEWRRQGVGRALIQKATERARSLSVRRIEIAPHPGNHTVAEAFLAACGFEPVDGRLMRWVPAT